MRLPALVALSFLAIATAYPADPAAAHHSCTEIASEDLNDGQSYNGVVVRNPFLVRGGQILTLPGLLRETISTVCEWPFAFQPVRARRMARTFSMNSFKLFVAVLALGAFCGAAEPGKDHKNTKECKACCDAPAKCDSCCHDKGKGVECKACCFDEKKK